MTAPHAALVVRGGTVVAMDAARSVGRRDVVVGTDGRLVGLVGPGEPVDAARTLDASGRVIVPGLVQAHLHVCQTLFRGLCEDRPLLRWLRERTWPLEAALDADALRASALLGIAELLLGGTTSILDMGSVHHTDVLFQAAAESGIRYTGGKAMMDVGEGVPPGLLEETYASLDESDRLASAWHGAEGGRLRYAYSPRFVLSCTTELLRGVAERARSHPETVIHTHASEQRDEAEAVRTRFGAPNIQALADLGLVGQRTCLAHCVWPEPQEVDVLLDGGAHVVHCPSCNLKLGSGIAPIVDYLRRGINVAIGADGAASNNRLDGWEELRLAALLAKARSGPEALPAARAFELATLGGARALGLDQQVGSLEPGKWADLAIVDLERPHAVGPEDLYTRLVFSARASDVRTVLVGGRVVVDEGQLAAFDGASEQTIRDEAMAQRSRLVERARLVG